MGILLAENAADAQGGGMAGLVGMVVIYGLAFLGIWFFMSRPQKKEQRRIQAMLADLAIGDSVLTTAGFYGEIIHIEDDTVIVEFGNNRNCRIPMEKSAISRVEKATE